VVLFQAKAFQAELALRQGRLAEASQWADQYGLLNLTPAPHFFVPPLTLALILLGQDTPASRQQARQLLSQLYDYFTSIHYTSLQIRVLALQASLYAAEGAEPQACAALEQAIGLAEPGGFVRVFFELGPELGPLFAQLERRGVAVAYIAEILAAVGGVAPHLSGKSRPGVQPTLTRETLPRVQSDLPVEILTNREMDVLLLLAQRLTNKEIAQALGISPNTVKQHTLTLFQKLQVHNRREAVEWARENHLLPVA
jgi:LuxR family maltose regulon positive regulatory protein